MDVVLSTLPGAVSSLWLNMSIIETESGIGIYPRLTPPFVLFIRYFSTKAPTHRINRRPRDRGRTVRHSRAKSNISQEAAQSRAAFSGPRRLECGKQRQACQLRVWLRLRPCAMQARPDAGAVAAEILKRPDVRPEARLLRGPVAADWGWRFARMAPGPAARIPAAARHRMAARRKAGAPFPSVHTLPRRQRCD